ncbi:putative E3 ubiquitin-protein ligase LIN-1 [Platanthera guangdongensis]|uniref:E3 ubiquitin-protein ligase LIN-1 n=1 Tax=Platanthera guangdongensis TaxID=2320717 RepID=A0ABR2M067_9ASPA
MKIHIRQQIRRDSIMDRSNAQMPPQRRLSSIYGLQSSSPSIIGVKEMRADSQIVQPWGNIEDRIHVGKADIHEYDSKPKMQKLDQCASQMQAISDSSDADSSYPHQSVDYPPYVSYQHELTEATNSESLNDETYGSRRVSSLCSLQASSSAVPFGYRENYDQDSTTGFPKCFICPLKGLILKEPVTLETGYTFELAAIKNRFDQGIKTCPVTGQLLKYSTIPRPNTVFKHLINEWVSECFRNSPFSAVKQVFNSRSELAFLIFEQMCAGLSSDEKKENIKHLIALGGLQFLTQMLELGCLEVKSRAAEFLVQCIKADGCYRKFLVMNIRKSSLLELIHSWRIHEKINAASLLIELICLDRRMDITSFLSGLKTEASFTIMSDLLLCLKSSLPEERVLVAVLLLHLDLMIKFLVDQINGGLWREEVQSLKSRAKKERAQPFTLQIEYDVEAKGVSADDMQIEEDGCDLGGRRMPLVPLMHMKPSWRTVALRDGSSREEERVSGRSHEAIRISFRFRIRRR